MKKDVPKEVAPTFRKIKEINAHYGEILRQASEPIRQAYDAYFEEVEVPDNEPVVRKDDRIIELLKKQNRMIEKSTAANRKGFDSLRPISHQSLAELVKNLPPLPQFEQEDENWVSEETLIKHTGEKTDTLRKQRNRGESYPVQDEWLLYGRDNENRIWCKCIKTRKKPFYLKKSLPGQSLPK
jgi:hypothetical protein